MDLNIFANGLNYILVYMLKPYKYEQFSLQPIMSVIHRYLLIYSIRFHNMSGLTLFIPMELMTPSNAVRSLQIGKHMR